MALEMLQPQENLSPNLKTFMQAYQLFGTPLMSLALLSQLQLPTVPQCY